MSDVAYNKTLNELWLEIDQAAAEQEHETRKHRIEQTISRIEQLKLQRSNDAAVLYSLGYAWYMHPERISSDQIQEHTEQSLLAAVTSDPNYALAWLYLGHHAYDLAHYQVALERFERCASIGALPEYLQLKAEEMRLCCLIRLHGLAMSMDAFDRFVRIAERHPVEDVWPQELAKSFHDAANDPVLVDRVRMAELARRLDSAGHFENWFTGLLDSTHGHDPDAGG